MSTALGQRAAQAAAAAFGLLTLAVGLASVPLDEMAHQPGPKGPFYLAFIAAITVPAVAVGTVLAARRPRNPIGWLLLAIFLLAAAPAGEYAIIDYQMHHGTLPLGSVAVVLSTSYPVWLVLIAIMVWVFPDGRLPGGRWRPVAVILVTAGVLLALTATAAGAAVAAGHAVIIDATGNLANKTTGLTAALQGLSVIGVLASLLAWLAVQVPRYRRASYERRQQLKWLYSGAVIFVVSLFLAVPTPGGSSAWDLAVNDVISPIGFAVLPVCVGIAVLKYRLYAIDRIVGRVISYALISAVLAGVFAGLVLLATEVLPFKTPVAVAMATLGAAALFNPLRRRVQRAVDRRFNRSRYDAEAVIAAFTARLRDTVDLDVVRDDLAEAVHQAFEPAHVAVWLPGNGQQTLAPARALPGQQHPDFNRTAPGRRSAVHEPGGACGRGWPAERTCPPLQSQARPCSQDNRNRRKSAGQRTREVTLDPGACGHSGQKPRARPEPARTGRGPSPARCG